MVEKFTYGNAALFIVEGDSILVGLRHYDESDWKAITVFTTPGGKCKEGERPVDTARRETLEEIGCFYRENEIEWIGETPSAGNDAIKIDLFVGPFHGKFANLEKEKFYAWMMIPISELLKFTNPGFINNPALVILQEYLLKKKGV